jgi:hypothetical protein
MNTENEIYKNLEPTDNLIHGISLPFSVPAGYFNDFEKNLGNIIANINDDTYNVNWGKDNPYEVPQRYFEDFYGNFIETLLDDIEKPGIEPGRILQVPEHYFTEFPAGMLHTAKESQKRTGKVIPLKHHNLWKPIRLAAAAVLVLGIGMGLFELSYNDRFSHPVKTNPENILASVPKNELSDYVQQNYQDMDAEATVINNDDALKFENKDIIQYLNETGWDGAE